MNQGNAAIVTKHAMQKEYFLGSYSDATQAAEAHDVAIILSGGSQGLNYGRAHYTSTPQMCAAINQLKGLRVQQIVELVAGFAARESGRTSKRIGVRALELNQWQARIDLALAADPNAALEKVLLNRIKTGSMLLHAHSVQPNFGEQACTHVSSQPVALPSALTAMQRANGTALVSHVHCASCTTSAQRFQDEQSLMAKGNKAVFDFSFTAAAPAANRAFPLCAQSS